MRFASEMRRRMTAWVRHGSAAIASELQLREVLLIVGVGMLGYGAGQMYLPAGFIVPGAVLVWIARPVRELPSQAIAELVLRELLAKGR